MKREMKLFNQYVKQFDLKNKDIMYKFHHSYRVMEISKEIAKSLKLNEEDTYIATLAGLLHDIGRFNQVKEYKTFNDSMSVDHGDEGERVLKENDFIKEFTTDGKIIDIIIKSTKYHNKYKLDENIDEKTLLFCKIVRDADKLDIMMEQCNEIVQNEIILKKELLDSLYNKTLCLNKDCNNEVDRILRIIGWIFDLNFKYSFNYLKDKKIIVKKFNLLEIYGETEEINKLKQFINNEIEKRC